jgi:hypothetical protein
VSSRAASVAIGSVWIGIGVAWLLIAWLSSQGRLRYRSMWGIRSSWARTSPEVWAEAHREFAVGVGFGGGVTILGGLMILVAGTDDWIGTVGLLVGVAGSVGGQFVGTRRAKSAVARLSGA